jgi:Arc/MetJ-type ribon-helix-helix transcriptional regulator
MSDGTAHTRVTTVRLTEEQAVEVELVARVLRTSASEVIRTAIAEYLTKRKGEAEFARRLSLRIDQDRRILERLAVQCCCDQITARLVVCPVHPDRTVPPEAAS